MNQLPPFDLNAPSFEVFRDVLNRHAIEILDDEPESGFISFNYGEYYCGFVCGAQHYAHVPLAYTDDLDLADRGAFDADYQRLRREVVELCGEPAQEGRFVYSHRTSEQFYHYAVWQLGHCRLALMQNEYDIQFGLDISLRFIYADGGVETLLFRDNET